MGIYQNFKKSFFLTKFFDIKSKCEMICYVEKCCKNSNELSKSYKWALRGQVPHDRIFLVRKSCRILGHFLKRISKLRKKTVAVAAFFLSTLALRYFTRNILLPHLSCSFLNFLKYLCSSASKWRVNWKISSCQNTLFVMGIERLKKYLLSFSATVDFSFFFC